VAVKVWQGTELRPTSVVNYQYLAFTERSRIVKPRVPFSLSFLKIAKYFMGRQWPVYKDPFRRKAISSLLALPGKFRRLSFWATD
jgi:hypothetical protein